MVPRTVLQILKTTKCAFFSHKSNHDPKVTQAEAQSLQHYEVMQMRSCIYYCILQSTSRGGAIN